MNRNFIRAKEMWAKKMAGKAPLPQPSLDRIPPGQHEVKDFPVLDLGIRPRIAIQDWSLTLTGKVENPLTLDWEEFMEMPQVTDISDFHCVTTWSQLDMEWKGVPFTAIYERVKPKPEAEFLYIKCYDGYTTNLSLDGCLDDDVLIAHSWKGEALSQEHGGPARLVVPKLYAWKSAKFIKEIHFLDRDLMGYWELRGYSVTADPFTEDRFS